MCEPISIATAVVGIVGTIGSYSEAQSAAAAQNYAQQQQYQLQLQAYHQQEQAYNRQIQLNQQAASKAYMAEQTKIQAQYQKAALEADSLRVKSMRDASIIQASGRSGRSIGILAMDPNREYGRDLATLGLNLGFANANYFQSIDTIFDQATTSNNQAASSRSTKPLEPIKVAGPSSIGLITGIAGAGLSGYQAYSSLKAPTGFKTPSTPSGGSNAMLGFRIPSLLE